MKTFYTQKIVLNNREETVTVIRGMEHNYDLYVVGRGQKVLSPLTVGLNEWSECPELGAIGVILVASEFASTSSSCLNLSFLFDTLFFMK